MNLENPELLTKSQAKIIKAICIHQLDSLNRILNDEHYSEDDITLLLIMNNVSKDEFHDSLEEEFGRFEELYNNPEDLRVCNASDLSKFRHILAHIDEGHLKLEITELYPNAVKNLWKRLFLIESIENINRNINHLN
jgi:hypothetical protein